MPALTQRLILCGSAFLASTIALSVSQAPLGSPLFFALAAVMAVCYGVALHAVRREPQAPRRLLLAALGLAVAFRVPLAVAPVGADNDMVRYIWDGRVQRLGYNPYQVVPADPALAHTHTAETRRMPSLRASTPYPPAAQLFFRLVVSVRESARAMKLALVACDVLAMCVLWRWLAGTGRSGWLTLAYAWNPLVVLEVSHSGHIDALGALWIVASAYWLSRRRTALATVALVLAIATKLLPVVLAPLYWRRIRVRDALIGAALLTLLYLPFAQGTALPLGAVPNVVAHIRFNGPLFRTIAAAASPQTAAAVAVLLGLAAAVWARWRLDASDPAAWAWPMAISLALAPVVYPWYLLSFTPFLFSTAALPLVVWTISALPVYLVWEGARHGGRWIVPAWVMAVEYGLFAAAAAWLAISWRTRTAGPRGEKLTEVSRV